MILKNTKRFFSINVFIALIAQMPAFSQISEKTVISGVVADDKTGEPLTGVSVLFEGTTTGTITDIKGKYRIETKSHANKIVYSFLGYKPEYRNISRGKAQTINVSLKLSSIALNEVIVKAGKTEYKNKNNPAVELIEKVIKNKDQNNGKQFDYLEYKQYDKIQFALSNVSEKFQQSNLFGKYKFVFDNLDTTKSSNKNILPLFIKEARSDKYYRKDPEATKEIVRAEKTTNLDEYLDNKGVSANLNYLYQHVNIYDNEILFLTNTFISPIANNAPIFYRYFITDTVSVDNTKCIKLFFEPRNKSDFLFHGHLYVAMDTSYAVKKIDMGLNKNVNIDWVNDVSIAQDFDRVADKTWMLSKDEVSIDFGIKKNMMGLYGQRTLYRRDYKLNEPIDKKIFTGPEKIQKLNSSENNPVAWDRNRYVPLTKSEQGAYVTIDSIRKIPEFKRDMNFVMLLASGFLNIGKFEIGPAESFYSKNPVEGNRFRFGGRTSPALSKKVTFDGYVAYGLNDKVLKYNAGVTYSLTPGTIYQFPVKSIRLSYLNDVKIPGQELKYTQSDNILLSIKRGINDKFFLNKTIGAEYYSEFENHFSYTIGYNFTRQTTEGNLYFNTSDYTLMTNDVSGIKTSEVSLDLRYAPNESFYQGKMYRAPLPGKYPVIEFKIAGGSKSVLSDYSYLRLQGSISRRFYLSVLGYSDVSVEAGKISGKVPYPLLFIHNANQTYSYQKDTYNLMNFLEFVSDKYVALNVDHCFNGFFLNKVPLLKKLKLREVISCKALYGGLNRTNNPDYQLDLFNFPTDSNGIPLTYSFNKDPYVEMSVGITNIFKVFRIDLIRRMTYLNNPNVSRLGIRAQFRFDI
jgi:hypothetical protein